MIVIGKYKEIYKDKTLPSILDNISDIPCDNKNAILQHLKSGKVTALAPSIPVDVVSGKKMGIELSCMSDGTFVWRSDIIYYFEKYNLKLPDEFVNSIK